MPVTLDERLAALPIAYIASQVDGMSEVEKLLLEAELEGRRGVLSQVLTISLRESRLHGSDPLEVAQAILNALRLRAADSVAESRTPLPQRLEALRPERK